MLVHLGGGGAHFLFHHSNGFVGIPTNRDCYLKAVNNRNDSQSKMFDEVEFLKTNSLSQEIVV